MKSFDERLQAANQTLAPYAVPFEGTLGRAQPDPSDEWRFPFQRDVGRIIHSQAFRRLKGKTQVFVTGQGDHYRTRLTHTMEVAQISRDLARSLSLNDDLVECIALAHDLGHPPFGHSGEAALNDWMKVHDSHFEHNEQSHRIVTLLEHHTDLYPGLNLNLEVIEGLLKHRTPHDNPKSDLPRSPSLEAQVTNLADEIAYTAHDCDDGLRQGLFTVEEVTQVTLAGTVATEAAGRGTSLRGGIIHNLVTDLCNTSTENLKDMKDLATVYETKEPLITFSKTMRSQLDELREFLWNNMYLHPDVIAKSNQGKEIVTKLCEHYLENPSDPILALQTDANLVEAVKDYVSGMTDQFAMEAVKEIG